MKNVLFALLLITPLSVIAQPDIKTCTGALDPFETVWRGQMKAQIILAKNYFFDSANHFGTLDQRTAKLDSVVKKVFNNFSVKRKEEYAAAKCHFVGTDHNNGGLHSWKTIECDPGYVFDPKTLSLYGNRPTFLENNTKFSWYTGGSSRVEIDAVIGDIDHKIADEINVVRKDLSDVAIPTKYP